MATKRVVHLTDAQWAKIEPLTPWGPDLLLVLESKSLKRLSCESRASHKKPIPSTGHLPKARSLQRGPPVPSCQEALLFNSVFLGEAYGSSSGGGLVCSS